MNRPAQRWLVIHVVSPSEEAISAISEGLIALGGAAVEQDGDRLTTWLPHPADVDATVAEARASFAAQCGAPVRIEWESRDAEDWTSKWREGLGPRRVGERLIVTPSWTPPDAGPSDIVITIDPQMAFGTGEHASTRGVLRLMENLVRPGATVLDMGTGSGVLAIAAAKLGAGLVLGVENDGDALINTRENVLANDCADRIALEEATIDKPWLAARPHEYDLIVANVLSGVLEPLLGSFRDALAMGGKLIIAGIMEHEAPMMTVAALAAGLTVEREDREEGWWSAQLSPVPVA